MLGRADVEVGRRPRFLVLPVDVVHALLRPDQAFAHDFIIGRAQDLDVLLRMNSSSPPGRSSRAASGIHR